MIRGGERGAQHGLALTDNTLREWVGLGVFLLLTLGVAAIGSVITSSGQAWNDPLEKPWFYPPGWLFGPVWTALYVMMAAAAWLVWRGRGIPRTQGALGLWAVQLALNLAWTGIFFGLEQPGWALVEILVLSVAIAATGVVFWRYSQLASWLLVPYLAWVTFAAALNFELWRLN